MPFEPSATQSSSAQPNDTSLNMHPAVITSSSVFVNVKDNGARGDNLTDDASIIQSTIDSAPIGATIYFPPGTYVISKTIQLKNHQSYVGGGFGYQVVTIKQADYANLVALMAVTEYFNTATPLVASRQIRIANLAFDGNNLHNIKPPLNGGHGIIFMSANSIIEQCCFYNIPQTSIVFSDHNISGSLISDTAIENHVNTCNITTSGQYGIWVQEQQASGKCTDGYIRDCIVNNTANTAIFVERGAGWFLSGNHVYSCQRSGIVINNAWATSVMNNQIDGYGYDTSIGNYYTGIGVTCIGPRPTIVEGNIIAGSETNPNTFYQHLSINGNASTDARCIVLGNAVLGGYVRTSSSVPITLLGPQTIVVASVTNISVNQLLLIDVGGKNQELVTVTNVSQGSGASSNTITATFAKTHSGTYVITSSTSIYHSVGISVQSFGIQQISGQPFYVQLAMNQADGVGKEYSCDASVTTVLAPSHVLGDLQSDGNLKAAKHIMGTGSSANVVLGVSNGTQAPPPAIQGNDVRGIVSFGCGNGATPGAQVSIQFVSPYPSNPGVVISPTTTDTVNVGNIWYVSNISSTGFSVASTLAPSPIGKAANTYSFSYQVIG